MKSKIKSLLSHVERPEIPTIQFMGFMRLESLSEVRDLNTRASKALDSDIGVNIG